MQLPGRANRMSEPPCSSAQDAAACILPLLAGRLAAAPYVIVSHSMGCWVAVELLRAAQHSGGLALPKYLPLSTVSLSTVGSAGTRKAMCQP